MGDGQRTAKHFRAHLEALATEVDSVRRTDEVRVFLDAMARFWRYSPMNEWLIRMSCRHATRVAGRRTWEQLGRKVFPDAKPIYVRAPTREGFVSVPVFDVSQTSGKALPELDSILLTGETELVTTLERAAARLDIRVVDLHERPDSLGESVLGESVGGEVRVRPELPSMERAATLAHELAHELLHIGPRATPEGRALGEVERETEAEATAYVVMKALGLPSKAPLYLAAHGATGKLIVTSMQRIQGAAQTILTAALSKRRRAARAREGTRRAHGTAQRSAHLEAIPCGC